MSAPLCTGNSNNNTIYFIYYFCLFIIITIFIIFISFISVHRLLEELGHVCTALHRLKKTPISQFYLFTFSIFFFNLFNFFLIYSIFIPTSQAMHEWRSRDSYINNAIIINIFFRRFP